MSALNEKMKKFIHEDLNIKNISISELTEKLKIGGSTEKKNKKKKKSQKVDRFSSP